MSLKNHKQPWKRTLDNVRKEPLITEQHSQLVGDEIPLSHVTGMGNNPWSVILSKEKQSRKKSRCSTLWTRGHAICSGAGRVNHRPYSSAVEWAPKGQTHTTSKVRKMLLPLLLHVNISNNQVSKILPISARNVK